MFVCVCVSVSVSVSLCVCVCVYSSIPRPDPPAPRPPPPTRTRAAAASLTGLGMPRARRPAATQAPASPSRETAPFHAAARGRRARPALHCARLERDGTSATWGGGTAAIPPLRPRQTPRQVPRPHRERGARRMTTGACLKRSRFLRGICPRRSRREWRGRGPCCRGEMCHRLS